MKIPKFLLFLLLTITSLLSSDTKLKLPDILNPDKQKDHQTIESTKFIRSGPTIQIAILLDSSNSMDGLITQTKSQIWKIINELALANKDQKDVTLQVGLFEYGKSSLPSSKGYLQMLSPLTNDLDFLSEKLFGLKTNGGDEYAGWVIQDAVKRLQWSHHKDDLKLIIIAGNESFSQGAVSFATAIKKASKAKVIVNTIFCGNYDSGINLQWQKGAQLGGGVYMNIDQNKKVLTMPTPYDKKILALGSQLNKTYISYGHQGHQKKMRQVTQDKNAQSISAPAAVERSFAKASKQYQNQSWDLTSAYEEKESVLEELPQSAMPKELKNKSKKEVKLYLDKQLKKRKSIQKDLAKLKAKRSSFISKNQPKKQKDIGTVLVENLKKIAHDNGFIFKK